MSRRKVMFIKAFENWKVGHFAQMRTTKADGLIAQKIARQYEGPWPPRIKTKINLKDLNNG